MIEGGRIRKRAPVTVLGALAVALTTCAACSPARAAAPQRLHRASDGIQTSGGLLGAASGGPASGGVTGAISSGVTGAIGSGVSGAIGSGPAAAPLGVPGSPGSLGGAGGVASTLTTQLALGALETWVSGGATFVLHETASVLAETTTPRLTSTWFSAAYWKVAGLAAVLTLPFIFAAAIQALIRSDLALLLRAALGHLPLAMLAVAIAAPLTMLLLSASDELAAAVSSAAGQQSVNFLRQAIAPLSAVGAGSGSPFLLFLLGLFTVAGAITLWIELLMREAAVYVIVLMLPLAFAAFVWPARRIWVIRSLEVLVALILSKFAIVAVLSLGAVALGHSVHAGFAGMLAGIVLLTLGAFTPWALLRLLPLSEIASSAAGTLREQAGTGLRGLQHADAWAGEGQHWVGVAAHMSRAFAGAKAPAGPPVGAEHDTQTKARNEQIDAGTPSREQTDAGTSSGELTGAGTSSAEQTPADARRAEPAQPPVGQGPERDDV